MLGFLQLFRSSVSIILLSVAVFFPTLHFHPFFEHEYGHSEAHGHGVVHADFLAAVAAGHRHGEMADMDDVSGHRQSGPSYQINFLSLVSRAGPSLLNAPQTHCIFLFFEEPHSFRRSVYNWTFKPEHPPPRQRLFFAPNAPRSPPVFA